MKLTGARSAMFFLVLGAFSLPLQGYAQTANQAVAEQEGEVEVQEEKSAERKLADLILNVQHFASESQKETLMEIAGNSENSAAIRTIATALHDMQHTPSDAHKETLRDIVADDTASNEERLLAEVLAAFNHGASEGDEARLAAIE